MARRIRFVPPGSLVEVTCRTIQGRLLLRPTPVVADLVRGVLARSARLYPVQVHAFCFLSNHFHLLLSVESAQRLASFMAYLNSNLAREIGRTVDWHERFWGRRYQAIVVAQDEESQVERLEYVLRHGTKENLVGRPTDWPGASSVPALLSGDVVAGRWFDRTLEYRARRASVLLRLEEHSAIETLILSPLPCWKHLDGGEYRRRVGKIVDAIEKATAARTRSTGSEPLGARRLQRQDPHQRSNPLRRRPAPLVHAASPEERRAWRESYREFFAAFRLAAAALRRGARDTLFPEGSFPPSLPFVSHSMAT